MDEEADTGRPRNVSRVTRSNKLEEGLLFESRQAGRQAGSGVVLVTTLTLPHGLR